jgi:hypothetical protein
VYLSSKGEKLFTHSHHFSRCYSTLPFGSEIFRRAQVKLLKTEVLMAVSQSKVDRNGTACPFIVYGA